MAQQQNLSPIIELNTPNQEFSPTLSPDGKTIVFSSDRSGGLGDQDLWFSVFSNGKWSLPVNMRVLNSPYHDQQPCFTHDGRGLLFSSDRDGGAGAGDLYISLITANGWSAPLNLGSPVNTADSEKMPSLSSDNLELYFCRSPVDMARRMVDDSKIKIMKSELDDEGWQVPEALPAPVNLGKIDSAPRILADNRTLIFSSKREGGKGGYDLWRVQRSDRTSSWSKISNLSHVNSQFDEAYFSFDITGKKLVVAQRGNGNLKYDLFGMNVLQSVMTPALTLQGRVTNAKTGEPLDADIIVEVFGASNKKMGTQSDRKNGKYSITLPGGSDYSFTVEKEGFLFLSKRMDKKELSSTTVTNLDFGLNPLTKGEVLVIPTIYFDPDSAILRNDSIPALRRVSDILKSNPTLKFLITGHVADTPDQRQDPMELSSKRALAVKEYLVNQGCDQSRLQTKGMGSSKPVADNSTAEGREQNRRTEFEVISD